MCNFIKKIDKSASIKTRILEENLLSYRAKGIYSYLVSRPENWEYNMTNVINTSKDGRESVQKGIKELEKIGLLKRVKAQNSEGKFVGWEWEIYDTYALNIADKQENRQSGKPSVGKTVSRENRQSGKPSVGKTVSRKNRQSEKPSVGKAVRIINNINEKEIYKRKKTPAPLDVQQFDDKVVVTYPRYSTTVRPTRSSQ